MVALVTMAKGEKPYIREWMDYHFALGFTKIYIYDNSDNWELKELNSDRVAVAWVTTRGVQKQTYQSWLQHRGHLHTWVMYLDVDEFLVLHKHNTVVEFCQEYVQEGAVGINWYLFGNNGHENYEDDLVLRRFTRRQATADKHVKMIARCSDLESVNIHFPRLRRGKYRDTKGSVIEGSFNRGGPTDVCQINHYFCKSTEEFKRKCERGRADRLEPRDFQDYKVVLSFNDVEDISALQFYEQRVLIV